MKKFIAKDYVNSKGKQSLNRRPTERSSLVVFGGSRVPEYDLKQKRSLHSFSGLTGIGEGCELEGEVKS